LRILVRLLLLRDGWLLRRRRLWNFVLWDFRVRRLLRFGLWPRVRPRLLRQWLQRRFVRVRHDREPAGRNKTAANAR
jgi:hypothetical protein